MTTRDENQDTVQSQYFEPFPEPQTIPSGWDTSGLLSAPEPLDPAQGRPASAMDEEDAAES